MRHLIRHCRSTAGQKKSISSPSEHPASTSNAPEQRLPIHQPTVGLPAVALRRICAKVYEWGTFWDTLHKHMTVLAYSHEVYSFANATLTLKCCHHRDEGPTARLRQAQSQPHLSSWVAFQTGCVVRTHMIPATAWQTFPFPAVFQPQAPSS